MEKGKDEFEGLGKGNEKEAGASTQHSAAELRNEVKVERSRRVGMKRTIREAGASNLYSVAELWNEIKTRSALFLATFVHLLVAQKVHNPLVYLCTFTLMPRSATGQASYQKKGWNEKNDKGSRSFQSAFHSGATERG